MYGTMGGVPPEDYRLARAIILWGVNPSATSIHLGAARARRAARRRLRRRRSTRAARRWRAPPTCTCSRGRAPTSSLALAMINELVRRGCGRSRLPRRTRRTASTALARARGGVSARARRRRSATSPAHDIARAGRRLRGRVARGGALRLGRRAQPQRRQRRARHPGAAGRRREVRRARRRLHHEPEPRLSDQRRRRWRGPTCARGRVRQINMMQLGRVLTEPQTPPMRALFVYNANPVAMTPNQNLVLARPGARRPVHRRARPGAHRHRALRRRRCCRRRPCSSSTSCTSRTGTTCCSTPSR